jgi:hypothetical protein
MAVGRRRTGRRERPQRGEGQSDFMKKARIPLIAVGGVAVIAVLAFQFMQSSHHVGRNFGRITPGMSARQVEKLMGPADERGAGVSVWRARQKGISLGTRGIRRSKRTSSTTYVVWFRDGKVLTSRRFGSYKELQDVATPP